MNATQKGNANRLKTKKWYKKQGYDVGIAESARYCFFGGKPRVFKQDLFGADLVAMNGEEIIFIQCKSKDPKLAECRREFAKWQYPKFVKKVVVSWKPRAREPRVEII